MEGRILSVAIFSIILTVVWAYPTTVPPTPAVCAKMTPGHGPSPQKSQAPYQIDVDTNSVKGGSSVKVTLSGIGGAEFKGFYVQARDNNGSPIGVFIKGDGVKTHGCGGIKNNAAHHAGKDSKESIVVVWQAPKDYSGDVTFTATFVQEFEVFWTQVRSSPVSVSNAFNLLLTPTRRTLITDSREEGETTESTQESRVLNYNPYSPTILRAADFDSKDFIRPDDISSTETPASISTTQRPLSTRIRKSYYIPKQPQVYEHDTVTIQSPYHDCTSKPHRHYVPTGYPGNINLPQEQGLPSYYNPNAYKQLHSTPKLPAYGSHGAGYMNLGGPSPKPLVPHPEPVGFINDPSAIYKRPESHPGFRPSFFPADYYNKPGYSSTTRSPYRIGSGFTVGQNPDISGYGNYPVNSGQHGILVGDYIPISNPGIVIPKGMQSYQIPRYGYLVFNPKKGPPFYLIPVGVEDTASFEEAHHLGDRFEILPQPAIAQFRSSSGSGGISFESGNSVSRKSKL